MEGSILDILIQHNVLFVIGSVRYFQILSGASLDIIVTVQFPGRANIVFGPYLAYQSLTQHQHCLLIISAANRSIGSTTGCTITEKAPTRAFSWLKAPTSAFTFKTLLRHFAKWALTLRSLNVKLGLRHKSQKGRAGWLA